MKKGYKNFTSAFLLNELSPTIYMIIQFCPLSKVSLIIIYLLSFHYPFFFRLNISWKCLIWMKKSVVNGKTIQIKLLTHNNSSKGFIALGLVFASLRIITIYAGQGVLACYPIWKSGGLEMVVINLHHWIAEHFSALLGKELCIFYTGYNYWNYYLIISFVHLISL